MAKATSSKKIPAKKPAAPRKRAAGAAKGVSDAPAPETCTLPVLGLLRGYHARRRIWAAGRRIFLGQKGGRGGVKPALMMTGSRSGDLPWTREDDADLLAEDWELIDPATGVEPVIG
ncbi:hypothetical protein [Roseobacter sp.]|uniref:hypothetical protein n=1 Tax=Roseobacter sp. TaxID=1907202 RepID=UPI00296611F4|nr:hypothetical protein [Roseobacter sp.]MDW3181778.1 hypothetical protein [Roseobacter sp.]